MHVSPAERCFRRGLAAMTETRDREAAEFFLQAMQAETRDTRVRPDMRFLSYYGLSLAKAKLATSAAIRACEIAVNNEPANPVLWLNLGRVYSLAGQIGKAISCLERGLRIDPTHGSLRRELTQVERRDRPVLPFIARSHPANRSLGRLRAVIRRKRTTPKRLLLSSP